MPSNAPLLPIPLLLVSHQTAVAAVLARAPKLLVSCPGVLKSKNADCAPPRETVTAMNNNSRTHQYWIMEAKRFEVFILRAEAIVETADWGSDMAAKIDQLK